MKKGVFWIYDVTVEEVRGKDSIVLWGLDEDGVPHVFIDSGFTDHVYVAGDPDSVEKVLSENPILYRRVSISNTVRRFLGREYPFTMISGDPASVRDAGRLLNRFFEVFELDVRLSQKYILYKGVKPSRWYNIEYEDIQWGGWRYSHRLMNISLGDVIGYPDLKVVAVDLAPSLSLGEPDPDGDPLYAYALYSKEGIYTGERGESEYRLFKDMVDRLLENDPDVIVTFMGNRVYYPYLRERGGKIGLKLGIGRYPKEIYQSVLGHYSIGGRINIDLYEYVDGLPFLQLKTLEELARYLGLPDPPVKGDPYLYDRMWMEDRDKLIEYLSWRVETIYKSFERLAHDIIEMSSVTGIPLDYVLTSSSGRQVEFYIMCEAVGRGEVIPPQVSREVRSYQGGMVLEPVKGLHRGVAVIDFKSMYPSIMIKYNISPETVTDRRGDNVEFFEEVGLGVHRDREGLLPTLVEKLIRLRDEARRSLTGLPREDPRFKVVDARQRIYKILANTVYGYMGWPSARWYSRQAALLVTYLGRQVITATMDKASKLGLEIIYGDTDSLFVRHNVEKIGELLSWVENELGMEAKLEKVYKRVIFTSAKKRYAGIYDSVVELVGLEYLRRDWCRYARNLQYDVASEVLVMGGVGDSLGIVKRYVDRLRRGEVPLDDLVIWEQISKPLDEYKVNSPHIEVARKLAMKGWKIRRGVFIGYVIQKGDGPIYTRAVHYLDADPSLIDVGYYVKHQLIPSAHRVLEPIGVSRKEVENVALYSGRGLDAFM